MDGSIISGAQGTQWVEVARLGDIPRLGSRVVSAPKGDVAIFRTSDDSVFALDDHCPHKGGPLSQGIVHGHNVTCPLHNWVIDLSTGEAQAPDIGCVKRTPVRLEGDRILLALRA